MIQSTGNRRDLELAMELLEVHHASELDRFLPLLLGPALTALKAAIPAVAKVAPAVMKVAMPMLRKVAVKAIPMLKRATVKSTSTLRAGAAKVRAAPGGGAPGGEGELSLGVSTRDARRWGTAFSRASPRQLQIAMSLRFVRAARRAARLAALDLVRLLRHGQPLPRRTVRSALFRAMLNATRRDAPFLLPTMSGVAIAMRNDPGVAGRTLPSPRGGRTLLFAPAGERRLGNTGLTGPALPTPRGRALGPVVRPARGPARRARVCACKSCQSRRPGSKPSAP
ncbi:hypothetical protein [Sorangium sp. So ce385]|uniref:hypothetical protein n=1 Tax=Sorangium sp. So ce385 TaxID=3133308 RepID=UPI003F5B5306